MIFTVMLFMYGAVLPNVKRSHFEIFWNSHQMFSLFFILLLSHGKYVSRCCINYGSR